MSFFKKRRVRKFAEQATEKQSEFYVFGSNNFAEAFIEQLILIGAKNKVSLISDKKLAWIEEIKDEINVLYEEVYEEYSKRNLYETIGFHRIREEMHNMQRSQNDSRGLEGLYLHGFLIQKILKSSIHMDFPLIIGYQMEET